MIAANFAGSSGVMDVPAPKWLSSSPTLFSHWGEYLVNLIASSRYVLLEPGESLDHSQFELAIVINGGLYCTIEDKSGEAKHLLVSILLRGSITPRTIHEQYDSCLKAASRTTCLVITKDAMPGLLESIPNPDELISRLEACSSAQHEAALTIQDRKDIERIVRVLRILSSNPSSAKTNKGYELMISKGEIRHLAGVQKRSASRAFNALETAGVLQAEGYKLLYFIEEKEWLKETP